LNDWLNKEFKERVSRKRKLILTDKLSTAFKAVQIPVSKEMIEEEEKVIDLSSLKYSIDASRNIMSHFENTIDILPEYSKSLNEIYKNPEYLEALNRFVGKIREMRKQLLH